MRVFVITGAGISAESGIPTFRGAGGYWRNIDPMTLATPEAFGRDPQLVWQWYNERRSKIRAAQPNAAHEVVANLARQADEFLLVTQNVDDLHARAGLPNDQMVQIHGDIFETRCSGCGYKFDAGRGASPEPPAPCAAQAHDGRLGSIAPTCPECGALMRPGVVWFGEMLDPRKIAMVEDFLAGGAVDLTVVIGTTALFGYIIDWAIRARDSGGQLIEINPDETPLSRHATKVIREAAAIALPKLASGLLGQRRRLPE